MLSHINIFGFLVYLLQPGFEPVFASAAAVIAIRTRKLWLKVKQSLLKQL